MDVVADADDRARPGRRAGSGRCAAVEGVGMKSTMGIPPTVNTSPTSRLAGSRPAPGPGAVCCPFMPLLLPLPLPLGLVLGLA